MTHDKFCRFANDGRSTKFKAGCFDCHRLVKARKDEREKIITLLLESGFETASFLIELGGEKL